MRVLIVKDHPHTSAVLVEALMFDGYDVGVATTYEEGRQLLLPGTWDVVVSDMRLPGGSGTELAAMAREMGVQCLVVAGHPEDFQPLEA